MADKIEVGRFAAHHRADGDNGVVLEGLGVHLASVDEFKAARDVKAVHAVGAKLFKYAGRPVGEGVCDFGIPGTHHQRKAPPFCSGSGAEVEGSALGGSHYLAASLVS